MNPKAGFIKAKKVEKQLNQAIQDGNNLAGWTAESEKLTGKIDDVTSQLAHKAQQSKVNELNLRVNNVETNKAGIDEYNATNKRIDELIVGSGDANAEVTDAHVSISKNKTFDTIGERLNEIEKENYIPFTNLIVNGSFEDKKNGWTSEGPGSSEVVFEESVFGNNSLKIVRTNNTRRELQSVSVPVGHLVYESLFIKLTDITQGYLKVAGSTELVTLSSTTNGWERYSGVSEVKSPTYTFNLGIGSVAAYTVYFDGILVIDLTETFGAGNEPSKEEMDELLDNIGWFDGKKSPNKELIKHTLDLSFRQKVKIAEHESKLSTHKNRMDENLNLYAKNLIKNGNFERGEENWTRNGAGGTTTIDTSIFKFGENSLKIDNLDGGYRRAAQEVSVPVGHVVYESLFINVPEIISGYLRVFGNTSFTITSPTNGWERYSNTSVVSSSPYTYQLGVSNEASYVAYFDGVVVLDLTEIFGAGNEPSAKEVDSIIDTIFSGWIDEEVIGFPQKETFNFQINQINHLKESSAQTNKEYIYNDMSERIMPIVAITHDDGRSTDYELYKMLQRKGMRATSFIVGSYIGGVGYLTESQLKEMADAGYEIACHTYNHNNLTEEVFPDGVIHQILENKKYLESVTDKKVETIAHPFGGTNEEVRNLIRSFYEGARTSASGRNEFGDVANVYNMKTHWMDYGSWTVSRIKTAIDDLVNNKPHFMVLSGHQLATESGGNSLTLAEMEEVADYLKVYQMQGKLEVVTFAEGVRRIKSYPLLIDNV